MIEMCQRFMYSKLKWQFSICNLTETWVAKTLGKHLEAYQKYQETSHLSLPRSKLGLEIKTFKLQNKSIMNAKLATELF